MVLPESEGDLEFIHVDTLPPRDTKVGRHLSDFQFSKEDPSLVSLEFSKELVEKDGVKCITVTETISIPQPLSFFRLSIIC